MTDLTLNNILAYVQNNIHTDKAYAALPQEIRDLHLEACEAYNKQVEEQNAWNSKCARLDRKEEAAAERRRLHAIAQASERGYSESPNGGW